MESFVEGPGVFLLVTGMESPAGIQEEESTLTPPSHQAPQTGAWLLSTCLLHLKALNCENPRTLSSLRIQPNGKKIR